MEEIKRNGGNDSLSLAILGFLKIDKRFFSYGMEFGMKKLILLNIEL
jgi:hypothetical protein